MKNRTYTLKGKDVPVTLQGAAVQFRSPESIADVQALCKSEADLIELASSAYDVWLQGRLRAKAGAEGATAAGLNEFASTAQYQRRQEGVGGGGSKPKTAKGIATSKAAEAGNKLFAKCAADPDFRARMVRQGYVDEDSFNVWQEQQAKIQGASTNGQGTSAKSAPKQAAKAGK